MARKADIRKLAKQLRRERRPNCWLCGQPIDYSLHAPHPDSFSADHIQPESQFPELALVYSNLAPAHLACNRSRQTSAPSGLGDVEGMW